MTKPRAKFRKSATTEYFKIKVSVAKKMFETFNRVEIRYDTRYVKTGIFQDPERPDVFIKVCIDYKVKGLGAGRPIRCNLNYSEKHHPDFKSSSLRKPDVMMYYNELIKTKS